MNQVLERVLTVAQKKGAAEEAKFRDVVRRLARGEEIDPAKAITATEAAGRTLDDLQSAVEMQERRDAAHKLAAQLPEHRAAKEAAAAAIAVLEQERAAVVDSANNKFVAECTPLKLAIAQAEDGIRRAQQAASTLIETAPSEVNVAAVEAAARRRESVDELNRRKESLKKAESELGFAKKDAVSYNALTATKAQAAMPGLQFRVEQCEAAVATAEAAWRAAEAETEEAAAALCVA